MLLFFGFFVNYSFESKFCQKLQSIRINALTFVNCHVNHHHHIDASWVEKFRSGYDTMWARFHHAIRRSSQWSQCRRRRIRRGAAGPVRNWPTNNATTLLRLPIHTAC